MIFPWGPKIRTDGVFKTRLEIKSGSRKSRQVVERGVQTLVSLVWREKKATVL